MSSPRQVNILLVDDQPAKLLAYEAILSDLGENLIKATSARAALEHLLKTEIAVILIDVCMPEFDGFELAAMIRGHPRYQGTAIIFVSAVQITDPDRLRGYEAGAVDYVPVPVVPAVLRAKVRVFAELYRKTRQLEELNRDLEKRVAERTVTLETIAAQLQRLNEELEHRIETRTREREQALAQLFEARKMETVGQLTGGVAHDFNNLLMAILGSLNLLKKQLPDDLRLRRLLDNALQGAERGAALTQRLLAFARRQELKPEVVDLPTLVGSMKDLLARSLGPSIDIAVNLPAELAHVRVDANQLELAILNLAINGRDAMPEGGTLTISAQNAACPAPDAPASLNPGDYVRISLTDTGVGMDEAMLARSTEPFFTTKGPGKGTGLGLSVVQGLAMQSGGALELRSAPGRGTTADLWLPQAKASAVTSGPTRSLAEGKTVGACTILIVDDDALVRMGTAAMLEDLGHTVIEATSGDRALEMLRLNPDVDLVITDHLMPGMTGLALARSIRDEVPGLPVILATGYAELPEADSSDLPLPRLAKPFRQVDLAAVISDVMAKHVPPPAPVEGLPATGGP
jgi:signal transduction histidine kinase